MSTPLATLPTPIPAFGGTAFSPPAPPAPVYTMTIGGQPVKVVQGTISVQNQIGQRSTGSVQVWTDLGFHWSYGTVCKLYNAQQALVFSGFTSKDKVTKQSRLGTGYLDHQLTIMDNCYLADKRYVFGAWNSVSAGYIVNAILNGYLVSEGITATASSIAAGTTITEVAWAGKKISEALTWLATISGYWWNIDSNRVLWFQPYTGVPAPFVLDGTQVNVDSNLAVTYGNDLFVNRQFVNGAHGETLPRTEDFTGDGQRRSFTLGYPVSSISSIKVDGVAQTTAPKGSSGYQWYYSSGDTVIVQDNSGTILTGGDTLEVKYKGRYPIRGLAQNFGQIAAQQAREGGNTSGWVENVYTNAKITSLQAANQDASAILSHYAADMTQLEFDTLTPGLTEGQLLTVNLPDFGLSGAQMLITQVEITDGINEQFNIWFRVTAVGSPLEAAQWQTYWQGLMNQSADAQDLSSVDIGAEINYIFSSNVTAPTPTETTTMTKTVCPIIGPSTIIGPSLIIC